MAPAPQPTQFSNRHCKTELSARNICYCSYTMCTLINSVLGLLNSINSTTLLSYIKQF